MRLTATPRASKRAWQIKEMIKHLVMASPTLLVLLVVAGLVLLLQSVHAGAPWLPLPQTGRHSRCPTRCGAVEIPYPFGIGGECSMEGFALSCNRTAGKHGVRKPYQSNVEVLSISLLEGKARMKNHISSQCYNISTGKMDYLDWYLNFTSTPFRFSNMDNRFTVVGCSTSPFIYGDNTTNYVSGCVSMCRRSSDMRNGSACSGVGCCQTAIPENLAYYHVDFSPNFNTSGMWNFSRCSYAALMETASFNFSSTYVTSSEFYDGNDAEVPIVLDWAIRNKSCRSAMSNATSYACRSANNECVDSKNGPGYLCNCTRGYQGNPYLPAGCNDINECAADPNPCAATNGICLNTDGYYSCSCPRHMHPDDRGVCVHKQKLALWVVAVIGTSVGLLILAIISFLYMIRERRNTTMMKQRHFRQHGGLLLLEEMRSKQGISFKIFSGEEMEQSTNNFDKEQIIGRGGHGTVYKGRLRDNRVAAIKRCQLIDERNMKEFSKEMLILSQINHKNIVKLLGCCLEMEVPMLVYEFIQRGTLSQLIHGAASTSGSARPHLPFGVRLRIVHEAAQALEYLHSSASPPILHGDVKSSNILIDENYSAKLSDFGASALAPVDKAQLVTLVQGTYGYLDPEYMQTCRLTDKSDVYSLGVVLVEVITAKKVYRLDLPQEERSLSTAFLSAMRERKLEVILDEQIKADDGCACAVELLYQVAELARQCLEMNGARRPTMGEVAKEIGRLVRRSVGEGQPSAMDDETGRRGPGEEAAGSDQAAHQEATDVELSSGCYSMEQDAVASIAIGR